MKEVEEVRNLRTNRYIIIDDEPCEIQDISKSKPGKHGTAKARIEAVGIFDGQKRSVSYPVDEKINVPIIDKRQGQVVSLKGDHAQLMDLESYDTFDVEIPDQFQGDLEQGEEVQYLTALGRRKITRI